MQHHAQGFNFWKQDNQHLKNSPTTYTMTHIFALTYHPSLIAQLLLLIYIYIQGVTGGMCETSGVCSLC